MQKQLSILIALLSLNSHASTQDEINHLLSFITSTHCLYERNGTMHTGKEAKAHISKKYAYYADDIESAEDFIKYSATKSKLSGKYYKIHCVNEAPLKSKDWLLIELKAYRAKKQ